MPRGGSKYHVEALSHMKAAKVAGAPLSNRGSRALAKSQLRARTIGRIRLLVVVDATDASKRALQYISRILAGRDEVDVHLAYVTSGLPPKLLETGGSGRPRREEQIESDLWLAQRRWTVASDKKAKQILRIASAMLQRSGVAEPNIHTCVSSPLDARKTADQVLLLARDEQCQTVVVGHRAHSWLRGLGGGHLAEQLVRKAKSLAIWVVD
jgi:nucleotide-binding universal stress UspA family protein